MTFFSRRSTESDEEDAALVPDAPPDDNTEPEAQADELPPESRLFDTALGAGTVFEGTLTSDGNVRLDGQFKGTLNITENVLIGITAEIEADVAANNITIAGRVRGNVTGTKVHLLATARVWGDIIAEALISEDGAFIEGRISMEKSRGVSPSVLAERALPDTTPEDDRNDPAMETPTHDD